MPIDTSNTRFAKTEPPCLGHPARAAQPALGRVLERTFSNPDPNPQHPALPSPHPRAPCPTFTTRLSPPSSGAPPDLWSALTFPAIGRAARPSSCSRSVGRPSGAPPDLLLKGHCPASGTLPELPPWPREPCPSFPLPSGALPDKGQEDVATPVEPCICMHRTCLQYKSNKMWNAVCNCCTQVCSR